MTDSPRMNPPARIERSTRQERLARALRDNLHRRKVQARAQQQIRTGEPASSDLPPPSQGGRKPPA